MQKKDHIFLYVGNSSSRATSRSLRSQGSFSESSLYYHYYFIVVISIITIIIIIVLGAPEELLEQLEHHFPLFLVLQIHWNGNCRVWGSSWLHNPRWQPSQSWKIWLVIAYNDQYEHIMIVIPCQINQISKNFQTPSYFMKLCQTVPLWPKWKHTRY